jgi:hypothetical protein
MGRDKTLSYKMLFAGSVTQLSVEPGGAERTQNPAIERAARDAQRSQVIAGQLRMDVTPVTMEATEVGDDDRKVTARNIGEGDGCRVNIIE